MLKINNSKDNKVFVWEFEELELGVRAALENYSNVHRGSGHYSLITTELFEQARTIILDYPGLDKSEYALNRNGTSFLPCTGVQKQIKEFLETHVQKVYLLHLDYN